MPKSTPERPLLQPTTTHPALSRRSLLTGAGAAGLALGGAALVPSLMPSLGWAAPETVDLGFKGGAPTRPFTTAFPQKGRMVLQRTRPPLLETPFEVFNQGVFTPNHQFYVRWHWAVIPTSVNPETFRVRVHGAVKRELSLSMRDIMALPRSEMAAVNQCSGNSRGFFAPRVAGGEWGNGAMGNALWTGVPLKAILDKAGVKPGARFVRFNGADTPVVANGPDFMKSLAIDHARDGEVMVAFAMNGEALPLLNGFPLRLVVPGWYATYWVKMLDDIEVLEGPDENFWMAKAYTIPDTPHASMKPGETGVKMVPINRMVPRSFITSLQQGETVKAGAPLKLRGIAFGGDCGVKEVEISEDGGKSWQPATLGRDHGPYSFRRFEAVATPARGTVELMVRATNTRGEAQPMTPNWNPGGFMRNVVETLTIKAA